MVDARIFGAYGAAMNGSWKRSFKQVLPFEPPGSHRWTEPVLARDTPPTTFPPPTDGAPWLVPPPAPARRRVLGVLIAGFLIVQIAVPCSYYAGTEPTSERFAWRMFSSIHMSRWQCEVIETRLVDGSSVETRLSLPELLQESTLEGLHAGQLDLARKFLRRRLEDPAVLQVTYLAHGTWPSGKSMPPVQLSLERER